MLRLNDLETKMVLNWFVYHMPMEQRTRLMAEHPIMYNKLMNSEIMESRQRNDPLRLPYTGIDNEFSRYKCE